MQFYTNDWTVPDKGARKKIHGGASVVDDDYDPGSTSFLLSRLPSTLTDVTRIEQWPRSWSFTHHSQLGRIHQNRVG